MEQVAREKEKKVRRLAKSALTTISILGEEFADELGRVTLSTEKEDNPCDMAIEPPDRSCADEYVDLPPEFIPIAKKYGVTIAKKVALYVDVLTGKRTLQDLMKEELKNKSSPFYRYVSALSKITGEPISEIIKSKAAIKYYKWLRGLGDGESEQ